MGAQEAHITGDERSRGTLARDEWMFVEAMAWILRTGAPRRDLPEVFGPWNAA